VSSAHSISRQGQLNRYWLQAASDPGVERLRRDVGAVRPDDGSEFLVECDEGKVGRIRQGLEDTTPLPAGQIELAFGAVLEGEVQAMISQRLDGCDVYEISHVSNATAAAGSVRAVVLRARSQSASSSSRCSSAHSRTRRSARSGSEPARMSSVSIAIEASSPAWRAWK
jgi:hypothetical protein